MKSPGCEYELDRFESILRKLLENYSYWSRAEHECEVHGDSAMCEEYVATSAGIREDLKELGKVLRDLNLCIQRHD